MSLHTGSTFVQFPESNAIGSMSKDSESSNGMAAHGQSQSVKPIGSATSRFQIRSAKVLQHMSEPITKNLSTIYNLFEGGRAENTSKKKNLSKDELHKVCTSSTSCKHTDTGYKETHKTVGIQKNEIQTTSERSSSEEQRRFYQSNKSQSLDWRGSGSKAGLGKRTGITSGSRDHKFIMPSDSLEAQGVNNKITSQTEEYQPNSILWRIKAYNSASQGDQSSDEKVYPISGHTHVRMSRETIALERASNGQSLPARLKPRLNQGCIGEGSNPWAHLQQGESTIDQTGKRKGSWVREQGLTNDEEVTGNQTIIKRIEKLFGASLTDAKSDVNPKDSIRVKCNSTPNSDKSFPFSDVMDSIPNRRKSTTESKSGNPSPSSDVQQRRPFYSIDKAGTFPRQFSKKERTLFGHMQEPCTTIENKNEKREATPGLSVPESSKLNWSMERSFEKKNLSRLPADHEEASSMWFKGSPEFCGLSLERTRSSLSATAQHRAPNTHSISYEGSPTSPSSQGVKYLVITSEEKQPEKDTTKASVKRLHISERKCLSDLQDTSYSDKDGITQPKSPLASKGAVHSEIQEEEEDVFTVKTEGRKIEGVLEKLCVPSLKSVKNTIHMFEAFAQQSKSTPQTLRTRRALSVPVQKNPVALLKKSDSDKNLHYRRVVGNTEGLRTNLFSKSDASEETEGLSRTPQSISTMKVKSALEQSRETKESVEHHPTLKHLYLPKIEQDISTSDKNERRNVHNKHIDEPDFATPTHLGLRMEAMDVKARNPISQFTITQKSNVNSSLIKQQSINAEMDDDDEDTPTNAPDTAPLTVGIQRQSNPATPAQCEECQTSGCSDGGVSTKDKTAVLTVNGTHGKVLSSLSHSSIPVQTIALNNFNNNNYKTTTKDPNVLNASMAIWSSDEEDDEEEDEEATEIEDDSDSGESSVTITSNMSQSDRRSFSVSLVDLCNFGGVDYKSPDGNVSEDGEDCLSPRSASLSSDVSAFSCVTLLSNDELDRLLDDVRSLGDDTLQKYEDVQVVVLHKEVGSGLGFTLAGGVDQNKPVTVHRVIPGGVVAQEGSIFEGDQVLSINGTALKNSAHLEALRTLRKARGQGMAVVVFKRGDLSETQHSRKEARHRPGNTGKRVHVTLNKSNSDLGFSLEGGVDSTMGDKPLAVKKIFQGGPDSEVFPGDELLEVQGQSLLGMRRLDAWKLIKKLPPGPVEVLLNRPHQPH
ncbi:uncharacterized protein si:dkey-92i15.4 [Xyrauchen texanus]|uniref:uncharacterized protein si:dkey-92i15.4 n=1 Tax=Xyrauchen texanus TaxID=154827 RepID=UPI0022419AB6|nr:uncharacterized protein si:dkey-92i15.4 [Xyrauchen texanus]XP_051999817.1 uncharacterized protein si:dkey-92i15.4 [Xyrauchen texanus]XP_051999818.1 uncharacterized protein si:dkey-92i15.4 [Xyrauchen texanus]XP_051999819.1 uncharacterized protein si:dkey-92i15.4 [Xyrauchen texanus]